MNKSVMFLLLVGACTTTDLGTEPNADPVVAPEPKLGCFLDGLAGLDGVLGEPVTVQSSYHGWCEEPDQLPLEQPGLIACAGVPHDLAIECSGPCDVGPSQPAIRALEMTTAVTPLSTDPISLSVRMTSHEDAADTHTCRSRTFRMLVPDGIVTTCNNEPCESTYAGGVAVCFKLVAEHQQLKSNRRFAIEGGSPSAPDCVFLSAGNHELTARHGDLTTSVVIDVTKLDPAM